MVYNAHYIFNIILKGSEVIFSKEREGENKVKKKYLFRRITLILRSEVKWTPINNLIFCRNFEVVPDEFISCTYRANNASAKIEGVMDDNYQQNALIILLALREPRPSKFW